MLKICFNSKKYVESVTNEIKTRAEKTKWKLYIEINWKLLEDDFAQRIFPGYDPDNKNHQGGTVAAPVASQILSEVLPYLGVEPDQK